MERGPNNSGTDELSDRRAPDDTVTGDGTVAPDDTVTTADVASTVAAAQAKALAPAVSTGIDGVLIGHWSHRLAGTGCTVIRLPPGTVASGEIRGGAPATREFGLLDPIRTVDAVDAIVLTGGSAFGLSTADGVMAELEADERGFPTPACPVPIVVAMALFDLAVGDPSVRPGPNEGRLAYRAAAERFEIGRVGAGTGATVDKWSGTPKPGGLGARLLINGEVAVLAVVAVNAFGALDPGGDTLDPGPPAAPSLGTNTTIGAVITNAALDKYDCQRLAQSAHDGYARALLPAHTPYDGDAVVAAATGAVEAEPVQVRVMAQVAMEGAIRTVSSFGDG